MNGNVNTVNVLFGLFTVGIALYFFYGYYMAKYKQEILESLFLPKGVEPRKCKDREGYCKEIQLPILVLAIVAMLSGIIDLYCAWVANLPQLVLGMIVVVFIVLIFYSVYIKKVNKKYFDL